MIASIFDYVKSAVSEQIIKDPLWASIALIGQMFFASRFILQWLISEYKKKSHVPVSFWFLSIIGSLMLLAYSIHIKNPIFIFGFSLNILIYLRNLHLIYIDSRKKLQPL